MHPKSTDTNLVFEVLPSGEGAWLKPAEPERYGITEKGLWAITNSAMS